MTACCLLLRTESWQRLASCKQNCMLLSNMKTRWSISVCVLFMYTWLQKMQLDLLLTPRRVLVGVSTSHHRECTPLLHCLHLLHIIKPFDNTHLLWGIVTHIQDNFVWVIRWMCHSLNVSWWDVAGQLLMARKHIMAQPPCFDVLANKRIQWLHLFTTTVKKSHNAAQITNYIYIYIYYIFFF